MPVTLVVWVTSSSETFTDGDAAALGACFEVQGKWVSSHRTEGPSDPVSRGVGLFQQVENPRVALETAQWISSDEHNQWLATEAYKTVSAPLAGHLDFSQFEYFHLDSDVFRPVSAGSGLESLLESPILSVSRAKIPSDKKDEALKVWERAEATLENLVKPRIVRTGFRIQKSDPDTDELVVFVGWPTVEKHAEVQQLPAFAEFNKYMGSVAKSLDVTHYKRIL